MGCALAEIAKGAEASKLRLDRGGSADFLSFLCRCRDQVAPAVVFADVRRSSEWGLVTTKSTGGTKADAGFGGSCPFEGPFKVDILGKGP